MTKDIRLEEWYVDINKVRTDYPVIENLSQWILDTPPMLHPYHPVYIEWWSKAIKKCIEGMWGSEFGKYRWMPGNLFFFGNFWIVQIFF